MDKKTLEAIRIAQRTRLDGLGLSGLDLHAADLSGAALDGVFLRRVDLSSADLNGADLRGAKLLDANLSSANLRDATLSCAYLYGADLSYADLSYANLRGADLRGANLSHANLHGADLGGSANLSGANLSSAIGLLSAVDYMTTHFERTSDGYIAYKIFGREYDVPESWKIKKHSVIKENVNFDRTSGSGCGINVSTLDWMKRNYGCKQYDTKNYDIWKVLIRWEWLCGVCVPYTTDGNIRCERVELIDNHIRLDEVE